MEKILETMGVPDFQKSLELHQELKTELREYLGGNRPAVSSVLLDKVSSYNLNWVIQEIPKAVNGVSGSGSASGDIELCAYRVLSLLDSKQLRDHKDEVVNALYYSGHESAAEKVYGFISDQLKSDTSFDAVREDIDSRVVSARKVTMMGPNPFVGVQMAREEVAFDRYRAAVRKIGEKLSAGTELSREEVDLMKVLLLDDNEYRAVKEWKDSLVNIDFDTYKTITSRLVELWKDASMSLMLVYQAMALINPEWTKSAWRDLGYDPDLGAFDKK